MLLYICKINNIEKGGLYTMKNISLLNLHSITLENAKAWSKVGLYFIIKDGKIYGLSRK